MAYDDIASLVKFCTIETGLKILHSQSLRWSAPSQFNDPFELSHNTRLEFGTEGLLKAVIKDAITMLFGPNEPTGKSNKLVAAIARWRSEDRFQSEDEAEVVLRQLLGQIVEQHYITIDAYMSEWREFAAGLRICSFSDKPDNMVNWLQYGSNHSGIAMKFSCGEDTSLPQPQRMTYSTVPPVITDLSEQVDVIYGRRPAPDPEDFINKLLVKDKNRSTEKEWRCFSTDTADDGLYYTNNDFSATELKAVYFGLATSVEDKEAILKIIKEKYSKTRVFQAVGLAGRYAIEFEQVATR